MIMGVDSFLSVLRKRKVQVGIQLAYFGGVICCLSGLYLMKGDQKYYSILFTSILLLLVVLLQFTYINYWVTKMQIEKRSLTYNSPKYLYEVHLPNLVYNVHDLDFKMFKIENVMFNDAGILILDSFQLHGELKGSLDQYLLDIQYATHQSYCRKVENPFRLIRLKKESLQMLLELYAISVEIYAGLYLPYATYDVSEELEKKECLICGAASLKRMVKKFEQSSVQIMRRNKSEFKMTYDILYALLSIRYFLYLQQFYQHLSSLQKVELKKKLSYQSLTLFEFLIQKDAFTNEKLKEFMKKNQSTIRHLKMREWQSILFYELNQCCSSYSEIGFSSFNFTALMMSEGFSIPSNWIF